MFRKKGKTDSEVFEVQFANWLERITENEKPPDSLVAFNIGLFETKEGYAAYLISASSYSEEDEDWACNEIFTPKERYFYFPTAFARKVKWEQAQEVVVKSVKEFLDNHPDSFLVKTEVVTVGFDDGDLVRVK